MEDIVEEVLCEIAVGYDFEEYQPKRRHDFSQIGDDVFLMDSRVSISEANEVLGINLPAREFHTLGGLVMARLRRIPREGDYIVELGYRLTAVETTERALVKLRVEPNADAEATKPEPDAPEQTEAALHKAHGGARNGNGGGIDAGESYPRETIAQEIGDSDGQEVKTTGG